MSEAGINFAMALVSGVLGSFVASILLAIWEGVSPDPRHLKIVHLIGSAFTDDDYQEQLAGRFITIFVGNCYALFIAAVILAYELESVAWLAGTGLSVLLWILTGVSLTYFNLLHPKIRNGEMKAPGPFGLNYSNQSAVRLLVAHLVYGVVCGTAYGILS